MSWLVISLVGGSRRINRQPRYPLFSSKDCRCSPVQACCSTNPHPTRALQRQDSTTKCDRIRVVERKSVFFMPMLRNASPDDAFNYFPNSLAMRPM